MPGVAQLGDDAQPDRLDRPAGDAAEAVLHERLAGLGIEAQRLDRVDRRQRRDPVALGQPGLADVVLVRGELRG